MTARAKGGGNIVRWVGGRKARREYITDFLIGVDEAADGCVRPPLDVATSVAMSGNI